MDEDLQNLLRRRAPPHPDEPSTSRPRLTDHRPPLPEAESGMDECYAEEPEDEVDYVERPFNETASGHEMVTQ